MEIRRTANAGVLLKLDDVSILLDGVSRRVLAYLPTPQEEIDRLMKDLPDAVAFTHDHPDHFDPDFAKVYEAAAGKSVITSGSAYVGNVRIDAVTTRHMGKADPALHHVSYVLQGSKCVWFPGDASPQQLKLLCDCPKPDVLIVPFPYVATEASIRQLQNYLPCKIVLVHMPARDHDPDGIWDMVTPAIEIFGQNIFCPEIGENLTL